ncbi:MAG: radical SAM protein [Ignavibacteria bacterium]|nr:radical SAM protein [Ignavibacteria bacterium]
MIKLNHQNYYRLPWNLTDNSITWLEPTAKCNLACVGCYRKNLKNGHKSLEEVKEEIRLLNKYRRTDGISIAGGEPLLHPNIIDIVKEVKNCGLKPIINTNGFTLTKDFLLELKKAGVFGFTFHIDSKQRRPGWLEANELELNELRYHYAKMLSEVGDIACSFNSTVYRDTLQYIPGMVKWAEENIDIVNVMVFILYRMANNKLYDFFIGPYPVNSAELVYNIQPEDVVDIKAEEVYELIKNQDPEFDSCAYLNGTSDPESFKWLLSIKLATKRKRYGYMGSKGIEIIQTFHHLFTGKYLAYTRPKTQAKGKSLLLLGAFDKKLRKIFFKYFRNPLNIFRKLYTQSIMIIQPIDIMEDGRQNMCDGCPDITIWNGKLVWSCRMEEQLNYAFNVQAYPKDLKERIEEQKRKYQKMT